jgi:chromosome partitioning protein
MDGKKINALSQSLKEIKSHYDYVLIDTPPALGRLMVSGIVAADHLVTAMDVGIFSLDGLENIEKILDTIRKDAGKKIKTDMIILTKADESVVSKILKRKNHTDEVKKSLKSKFNFSKKNIFMIPNDKHVYESQVHGEPLSYFSPNSKASVAYKKVANEILKWN